MTEYLTSPYGRHERFPVHPTVDFACRVEGCDTRHPMLDDGAILSSSVAAEWSRVTYSIVDGIPLIVCKRHPDAGELTLAPRAG